MRVHIICSCIVTNCFSSMPYKRQHLRYWRPYDMEERKSKDQAHSWQWMGELGKAAEVVLNINLLFVVEYIVIIRRNKVLIIISFKKDAGVFTRPDFLDIVPY